MLVCLGKFTGYGLRVGGAGAVASSGAGLDVLRALGGCSLVAVFVYIRSCLPAALQVSKILALEIWHQSPQAKLF